jgi:hypothetical protein
VHPVEGVDLLQELLRDCHEGRALLDRDLLERERLVRLREAVLVGRAPEALEVMDVVDDRDASAEELDRDRGEGVREIVAVMRSGRNSLPAARRPSTGSEPRFHQRSKSSSPEPYQPLSVLPWWAKPRRIRRHAVRNAAAYLSARMQGCRWRKRTRIRGS